MLAKRPQAERDFRDNYSTMRNSVMFIFSAFLALVLRHFTLRNETSIAWVAKTVEESRQSRSLVVFSTILRVLKNQLRYETSPLLAVCPLAKFTAT
jgi:hypothetical protein